MRLFSLLLGSTVLADVPWSPSVPWRSNDGGGYIEASCKCDIECTPNTIDEICGADVLIALDMFGCDQTRWDNMRNFVENLIDQLDVDLEGFGGDRSSARVAVTMFAGNKVDMVQLDEFNNGGGDNARNQFANLYDENERDSVWTVFNTGTDLNLIFDWADQQFAKPRDSGVQEELDGLDFQTSKTFVIVSDGHVARMSGQQESELLDASQELSNSGAKIVTVTQSDMNAPNCRNGEISGCPATGRLREIGDVLFNGKNGLEASKNVAEMISSYKCRHNGDCKPCNCDCELPRGPAGSGGQIGCEGQRGACGEKGEPGPGGMGGEPGPLGKAGEDGPEGPCGEPGVNGEANRSGETGIPGEQGGPGPEGEPGARGQQGEQGEAGVKGFTGSNGVIGDPGEMGPPGLQGNKGEIGKPGKLMLMDGQEITELTPTRFESVIQKIVKEWLLLPENVGMIQCLQDCDDPEKDEKDETPNPEPACPQGTVPKNPDLNPDKTDKLNCDQNGNCVGTGDKTPQGPQCIMTACEEQLDIVFLVDGSDSISAEDWPEVSKWINTLLESIDPTQREMDTKVIYQQYSSRASFPPALVATIHGVEQDQNHNAVASQKQKSEAEFKNFMSKVEKQAQLSLGTDTFHAIKQLSDLFKTELRGAPDGNDNVTTVLVTLTDGEARDFPDRDEDILEAIRLRTDIMVGVGVGSTFRMRNELEDFAQDQQHILITSEIKRLKELSNEVVGLIAGDCEYKTLQGSFKINRRNLAPVQAYEERLIEQDPAEISDDDFLEFSSYWPRDVRHRSRH